MVPFRVTGTQPAHNKSIIIPGISEAKSIIFQIRFGNGGRIRQVALNTLPATPHARNFGGNAVWHLLTNDYVIGSLGEGYNFSRRGFISRRFLLSYITVYIQADFIGQFT